MPLSNTIDSNLAMSSTRSHVETLTNCKCGCNRERDIAFTLSSLVVLLEDAQYKNWDNSPMGPNVDEATQLIERVLLLCKEDYQTRYDFDWFSPHRIFQIYTLLFQNAIIANLDKVVNNKYSDTKSVLAAMPTQSSIGSATKFVALYGRISKPLFSTAGQYKRIAALFAYTVQTLMNTERFLSSFVPQFPLEKFHHHENETSRHLMGTHPALVSRVELRARKRGIHDLLNLVLVNTVTSPSVFRLARIHLEAHLADICLIQFVLGMVTLSAENAVKHAHTLRKFGLLNFVIIELGKVFQALLDKRQFDPSSTIGRKLGYSVELLSNIQSLNITLDPGSLKLESSFKHGSRSLTPNYQAGERIPQYRERSETKYRSMLGNKTCRRLNVRPYEIGDENSGIFDQFQRQDSIEKPVYERLGNLFESWNPVGSQQRQPLVDRRSSFNRRRDTAPSASKMVDIQSCTSLGSPLLANSNFLPLRPAPLPPMSVSSPLSIAVPPSSEASFLALEHSPATVAARIAFAHSPEIQLATQKDDQDMPHKTRFRGWLRAVLAFARHSKR